MYTLTFAPQALEDLAKLKKSEPAAFKKAGKLLGELRRISQKHRLIYEIKEDVVNVAVLLIKVILLMAILSLIALTSCQKAFDVYSVHFSNDGGTKTITSSSYTLSIHDNNANYGTGSAENGIIHVEKDWLTAELDTNASIITLTADKNDTGKKRTLYISGMYGDIQSSIPVVQDK